MLSLKLEFSLYRVKLNNLVGKQGTCVRVGVTPIVKKALNTTTTGRLVMQYVCVLPWERDAFLVSQRDTYVLWDSPYVNAL